jgi:hypothetical protein
LHPPTQEDEQVHQEEACDQGGAQDDHVREEEAQPAPPTQVRACEHLGPSLVVNLDVLELIEKLIHGECLIVWRLYDRRDLHLPNPLI